jgi:hypothetical protein
MDVEGSGRGLIVRHISSLAWRDWRKQIPQGTVADVRAEIWAQDLPNTKQDVNLSTTAFGIISANIIVAVIV